MHVEINENLKFPNGNYIFKEDGTQIDPNSEEGDLIKHILEAQKEAREGNRTQKMRWILSTFPRNKEKQEEFKKKFGL